MAAKTTASFTTSGDYLFQSYKKLGRQDADFRNFNLNTLILKFLKGSSLLDIGCGAGRLLARASARGMKSIGLEPNEDLVKLAKELAPGLFILKGSAEELEKVKEKVDNISLIDVLEHIQDDRAQLGRIYAQLNPSGRIIVVVPCYPYLYGKRDVNSGHYRRYTKRELIQKLRRSGFIIKKARYWNMLAVIPYIISEKILRKPLQTALREESSGRVKSFLNRLLNLWFKDIENNLNLGFGLSLIIIAEKPGK
ncbi:class I SAM-dependent methyltransferase [Candidatus Woesearchaeota archaeon]|nr:class I SAM-dependent methyltransferase [Candidatus Woesearchaeota archaeon]